MQPQAQGQRSAAIALRVRFAEDMKKEVPKDFLLAGETRLEHATDGFGDRCSTIEPLPYTNLMLIYYSKHIVFSQ